MAERQNTITPPMLSVVLILLMLCAWFTDVIGIYAIFGAFILGVAMPSGFFAQHLTVQLEPLVTTFLLPTVLRLLRAEHPDRTGQHARRCGR